jgi:hypothetical protein
LDQSRTAEECGKRIVEDYRRETEKMREPPPDGGGVVERRPELGAFGAERVEKWLGLRDRLVEIAKVLRRFPWMEA